MDFDKIKEKLMTLAKIGATPEGGIDRVFGSMEMTVFQKEMLQYIKECGMEAYQDQAGNIHGILSCGRENAEEILIGSHMDTVRQGGIYDGLLGVIAGVEVARNLAERKESLSCNLHVIGTNGEEGNELGGTFGSRAMLGLLPLEDRAYVEKLGQYGYSREVMEKARLNTGKAKCYLELHIEQGPTLDIHKEQIGIVTGIVGLRRYQVTVQGSNNHAGTTMMEDRNDALITAAKLILMGDELAREIGHNFVETVSTLEISPGVPAVIPGKVTYMLEIRNENSTLMDQYMEEFQKRASKMQKIELIPIVAKAPIKCDGKLMDKLEMICKKQKIAYRRMPSGATHDGNAMAVAMPVCMIFVPSIGGISHSKKEQTKWEDIVCGITILKDVVSDICRE